MKRSTKAAFSYVGLFITGLTFLVIEKEDIFIRKSAAQSTVLGFFIFALQLIVNFIPFVGWFLNLILYVLSFIILIILIIKAGSGIYYKLPIIGDISEKYVLSWFK